MPDSAPLGAADLAWLQGGVSISVAAADACGNSSLVRVLACTATDAGRGLRLCVDALQADELLRMVRAGGRCAVVISEPSTHRTMQIKSRAARVSDTQDSDLDHCRRHAADFATELQSQGWPGDFAWALLHAEPSRVAAIDLRIDEAFQQSPGPRAGERLPLPGHR